MSIMSREQIYKHNIVIRQAVLVVVPGELDSKRGKRFAAKDLRMGVGAGGESPGAAREKIMAYFKRFPEELKPGLSQGLEKSVR